MLKIDNFDAALIGLAAVWQRSEDGGATRVDTLVYNGDVIVTILVHQLGMSYEEAMEYISYNNIEGAYVGKTTPILVWPCTLDEIAELNNDD